MARTKATDPEARGHELIEELNNSLNEEFESRADYRTAIEEAHSFLEGVIHGLDDDDKRDVEKG